MYILLNKKNIKKIADRFPEWPGEKNVGKITLSMTEIVNGSLKKSMLRSNR
jgi:hypothetical protein